MYDQNYSFHYFDFYRSYHLFLLCLKICPLEHTTFIKQVDSMSCNCFTEKTPKTRILTVFKENVI